MYQSGFAWEQHIKRELANVEEMLRAGATIEGSNRDGVKVVTFKVSFERLGKWRDKQK